MPVYLNPTSQPPAVSAADEAIPVVPPGVAGNGISTIQTMATPEENSGSCYLWDMLVSFWSWLMQSCCRAPTPEELQETFQQKVEEILEKHLSDGPLTLIDQPEWKIGIISTIDDQTIYQFGECTSDDMADFRTNAIVLLKEQLENFSLSSNSKLNIKTIFMTKDQEKTNFLALRESVGATEYPFEASASTNRGLTDEERREYLEGHPTTFVDFFV